VTARIARPTGQHFHHDSTCPTPDLVPAWEPWADRGWRRLCERCRVIQHVMPDPHYTRYKMRST
jgi:hypothetical protein